MIVTFSDCAIIMGLATVRTPATARALRPRSGGRHSHAETPTTVKSPGRLWIRT